LLVIAAMSLASAALAAPRRGDVLQTDGFSMVLVTRDFTDDKTTSVNDAVNLSGLIGLHYYVAERVRLGVALQYTQRLWPEPADPASRFQRFAVMPQLGWNFADPFYAALIFAYAPRTRGRATLDMSAAALVGAGIPLSERVRWTVAVEAPWAFYYHQTVGFMVLSGLSFRF
jgi:hypothetical protein